MSSDTQPIVIPPFREWQEGAEIKTFKGRCHCGKITFEFDHPTLEARSPTKCNCSLCMRTGGLYIFGPESSFRLTSITSGEELSKLRNKVGQVDHRFCPTCGNMMYWTGMGRVGVNVRMLDGVDVDKLHLDEFDGARLL